MTSSLIRDCVADALQFTRAHARLILTIAALGAVGSALISGLSILVPVLGLFGGLASGFVQAAVYAAFMGALLFGADAMRARWASDGARVWGAMIVVGFFLFVVFFMFTIVVGTLLVASALMPFADELQSAEEDSAVAMSVLARAFAANPVPFILSGALYMVVWMLLTSRFYFVAPVTVEQGRIQTFETWKLTKGHMLRITGARLMLLGPAYVLMMAVTYVAGRFTGISAFAAPEVVTANVPGLVIYVLVAALVMFAVYLPLEAALSARLYQALKPAPASAAA